MVLCATVSMVTGLSVCGTGRRVARSSLALVWEDPPLFSDRFTQYCPSLLSDTTGLGTLKKSVTKVMSQEELNTRSI